MTDAPEAVSLAAAYDRVAARLVGRERELTLVLAAVAAGRDLILEGPPGTSKSTLLRAITAEWGIPLVFVEGNADLTPSKLIGHHNPARVLREDYSPDNFVDGPLLQAMREGGFLYIEEFNRAPEDTLNTLLTAMAERQVAVPTAGIVTAAPTFRVVASMNPYDNVGTTRLSTSVHDRICRLAIGYQDAAAERAIDLTLVAGQLLALRGIRGGPRLKDSGSRLAAAPPGDPGGPAGGSAAAPAQAAGRRTAAAGTGPRRRRGPGAARRRPGRAGLPAARPRRAGHHRRAGHAGRP